METLTPRAPLWNITPAIMIIITAAIKTTTMQTTTSKKMTTMANNCYVQHHANIPPNRWNNDNNRQQINKWATNEIASRYCSVGARYSLLATGSVQSAKALLHRLRCQRWRLQMIILATAVPCRHATAQLAPHCNCLSLPTRTQRANTRACMSVCVLRCYCRGITKLMLLLGRVSRLS